MPISVHPDILGPRVKSARTMAKLTQEEAALRLGIARTTLLAIEAGKRPLKSTELRAFADLYGVREGELISGSRQPLDMDVRFRSSGASSANAVEAAESAKDYAANLLNRLAATALELEELLNYSSSQASYPSWHLNSDQSIEDQAEDAALMFRQRLGVGLGPLSDLKSSLETEFGLRIFERPVPSNVSGACSFHQQHGGFILLNSSHRPERRQQTVAHEAGHGLVRPSEPLVVLDGDNYVEREDKFCDAFARALLMPAVAVRRKAAELKGVGPLTVRHVLWLAAYFRVSIEAMGRRMEALNLLTRGTYDSLKSRGLGLKHLEQVVRESDAIGYVDGFTPRLLFLAGEAYLRGLMSEQQIAEKLELDLISVRKALEAVDMYENSYLSESAV